jgi:hypothetical protein
MVSSTNKKWAWGVFAFVLLAGLGLFFVQRSAIALSLYQRGVERNLAQPSMDDLGEGLDRRSAEPVRR